MDNSAVILSIIVKQLKYKNILLGENNYMTNSSNSFRKFLATATTVTIVAGAVAPLALAASTFEDVAPQYKDAVDFVVSKGIAGFNETTYGTYENIKRVDAAVMIAKVLDLDIEAAPASGFTDVPDRAVKYVNALKAAGITSGKTTTTLDSQSQITRGELAIWIQRAFKLQANNESLAFTDVADRYKEAVSALVNNKVTSGTSATTFGTDANAKRGDFALFLHRAAQAVTEVAPVVESVTALTATTVSIEGTDLQNLTEENFSLEENTIASFEVNEEGTEATLTFDEKVASSEEQTLELTQEVEGEEVVTEFIFTYTLEIEAVSVSDVVVDNDTAGQTLTFTIDDEEADLAYLEASGYTVEFQSTNEIFAVVNEDGEETASVSYFCDR